MTNALLKSLASTAFFPGSPGVPSSPGSGPMPAYTSWDSQRVCGPEYAVSGGSYQYVQSSTGAWNYMLVPTTIGTPAVSTYTGYTCVTRTVANYHPATGAVAPTPGVAPSTSQTITDYNLGWNAGARSISFFTGNGYAQFKMPTGVVGVVVGLTRQVLDSSYVNIDTGFYFASGVARIYESGVQLAALGTYADHDLFRLERRAGTTYYYKNGALQYTSAVPRVGLQLVQASLYSGGDWVDSPAVGDLAVIATSFRGLFANGGQGAHGGISAVSFQPLKTSAGLLTRGAASFQPLAAFAGNGTGHASSRTALQPLTLFSTSGQLQPAFALARTSFPPLSTVAHGLTGQKGTSQNAAFFAPMVALGGNGTGHALGRTSFQPLKATGSAYEGNKSASVFTAGTLAAPVTPQVLAQVTINQAGTITTTAVPTGVGVASFTTGLTMTATQAAQAVLAVLMQTALKVTAGVPLPSDPGEVWVVNWDSSASSSYESYPINSFGQLGTDYYGTKTDGVYLLDGADDAGAAIHSSISFGKNDFGSQANKRVPNCYLGVAASGAMYLKVTVDGQQYVYQARSSDPGLRTQRVDLGRGLRSNYFTFELFNNNGSDFELDSVVFDVVTLSRKI